MTNEGSAKAMGCSNTRPGRKLAILCIHMLSINLKSIGVTYLAVLRLAAEAGVT